MKWTGQTSAGGDASADGVLFVGGDGGDKLIASTGDNHILAGDAEGVTVSRDAVTRRADGRHTVWVVDADNGSGVAREQPVTLGPAQGERVVVTDGLRGGEVVVVRGNESLRAGQRVAAQR